MVLVVHSPSTRVLVAKAMVIGLHSEAIQISGLVVARVDERWWYTFLASDSSEVVGQG